MSTDKKRLESLDVLRGMDLFLLLVIGPILASFLEANTSQALDLLRFHRSHVPWAGFSLWDIIMPLFMFMSGITIPFSMSKYKNLSPNGSRPKPDKKFYLKLVKRFCVLFFIGWIVQGNLLSLDWKMFHPFANTLQAIAVGYVFAAIFFVNFGAKIRLAIASAIFAAYFIVFAVAGDLNPEPQNNIAMLIDKAVLGSHRDGVIFNADGSWVFNPHYQYTWILSSLNFIITVMLGCFAGEMLKENPKLGKISDKLGGGNKAFLLMIVGILLIVAGLLLGLAFPIIKKIWSSSMTLYSGGICFVLIAICHYFVDVRGYSKGLTCFKYFGMNSIAAYFIGEVVIFDSISRSFLYGFEQYLGVYYPCLISAANAIILILVLRYMYKHKIFLKA